MCALSLEFLFQNIVDVHNSVFTPVFTDPKIVLKMGVVGNADLCVFWTRELEGELGTQSCADF